MSRIDRLPFAPSVKDMSTFSSLASGVFFGMVTGVGSSIAYGRQIGMEVGIAMGGTVTGTFWSIQTYHEGLDYAAAGNKKRAYLKAVVSSLEATLSGATLLTPLGHHLGSVEGAIGAALVGGTVAGIGSGRIIIRNISTRLRQGIKDNIVDFKPKEN